MGEKEQRVISAEQVPKEGLVQKGKRMKKFINKNQLQAAVNYRAVSANSSP